jgi:hypothetical protein
MSNFGEGLGKRFWKSGKYLIFKIFLNKSNFFAVMKEKLSFFLGKYSDCILYLKGDFKGKMGNLKCAIV